MTLIRVLHIVGRMDRGGIESFIMNLYRNIDKTKVQFDFLCHYGKEAHFNDEIRLLGGKIYEMPMIKSTKKTYYWRLFEYINALNDFFSSHEEHIVIHCHMTNTASIYIPIAKKYGKKYVITHSHQSKSSKGVHGIFSSVLQIPIYKMADDFFSCSSLAANWLYNERVIKSGKVKIIPNAVDAEKFRFRLETRSKTRELLNLQGKFVVGHVGRFYAEKNHTFLIEIFHEVVKIKENARLILVGEGELKKLIERKVEKLGIKDKVYFLGSRCDVDILLQTMDVFVMPSLFEGLPVAGIEAQASGLKCFFSDTISTELDITGNSTFLSLKNSAMMWAHEIIRNVDYVRKDVHDLIVFKGFDIKTSSRFLQDYYSNVFQKCLKDNGTKK